MKLGVKTRKGFGKGIPEEPTRTTPRGVELEAQPPSYFFLFWGVTAP